MFSLLLDDALEQATPLTNGAISETLRRPIVTKFLINKQYL